MHEVVVPLYAVGFIYIPGEQGFVSFIRVQSYDVHKQLNTLWLDGLIRLFAPYSTSLSLLYRRI